MNTKVCCQCGKELPITMFNKRSRHKDGYRNDCKSCRKIKSLKFYNNNKDKIKDRQLKYYKNNKDKILEYNRNKYDSSKNIERKLLNNYNIDKITYNEMLLSQNGVCKICGNPETCIDKRTGSVKNLAVDHCHSTGKIRGLLCSKCNRMIGFANDSTKILSLAIKYLKVSS